MKKGTQRIVCDVRVSTEYPNEGAVALPPNETYELVIHYPMLKNREYRKLIKTGKNGISSFGLCNEISEAYRYVYAKKKTYGPFFHDFYLLVIEGIVIDHDKKMVTPIIGA
jgi:hypothetical protein